MEQDKNMDDDCTGCVYTCVGMNGNLCPIQIKHWKEHKEHVKSKDCEYYEEW